MKKIAFYLCTTIVLSILTVVTALACEDCFDLTPIESSTIVIVSSDDTQNNSIFMHLIQMREDGNFESRIVSENETLELVNFIIDFEHVDSFQNSSILMHLMQMREDGNFEDLVINEFQLGYETNNFSIEGIFASTQSGPCFTGMSQGGVRSISNEYCTVHTGSGRCIEHRVATLTWCNFCGWETLVIRTTMPNGCGRVWN